MSKFPEFNVWNPTKNGKPPAEYRHWRSRHECARRLGRWPLCCCNESSHFDSLPLSHGHQRSEILFDHLEALRRASHRCRSSQRNCRSLSYAPKLICASNIFLARYGAETSCSPITRWTRTIVAFLIVTLNDSVATVGAKCA